MAVVNRQKVTNLNGLNVPPIFVAKYNTEEEYYISMFNAISNETLIALDKAYINDLNGFKEKAKLHYQGLNICYYLVHLAFILKENEGTFQIYNSCEIAKEINVDCVLEKLSCLSNKYKIDFVKVWNKLLSPLGFINCKTLEGEFSPCDFLREEFSKAAGVSIYNNCKE